MDSITVSIDLLDDGGTSLETLTVNVILIDMNDNPPVWRNPITALSGTLPEVKHALNPTISIRKLYFGTKMFIMRSYQGIKNNWLSHAISYCTSSYFSVAIVTCIIIFILVLS